MDQLLDTLWKNDSIINEWIRFSDTKATTVLALNGVIIGILSPTLISNKDFLFNHQIIFVAIVICFLTIIFSTCFCICCLNPTLKFGNSRSLIFFSHIAKYPTSSDYSQSIENSFNDECNIKKDLCEQIWINSIIANKKNESVKKSINFLIFTFVIGIPTVVAITIILFYP